MFKTLECRSPAVFGLYQQNRDQIVGNLSLQGEKNEQKTYKCIYSVNNFFLVLMFNVKVLRRQKSYTKQFAKAV